MARAHLEPGGLTAGSDRRIAGLITTGPYALVRHPLYGGLLLAVLGSAIGQSVLWLLPLIVYGPLFIISARREEKRLLEEGLVLEVIAKSSVHDNPHLLTHLIDWHLQVKRETGEPPEQAAEAA